MYGRPGYERQMVVYLCPAGFDVFILGRVPFVGDDDKARFIPDDLFREPGLLPGQGLVYVYDQEGDIGSFYDGEGFDYAEFFKIFYFRMADKLLPLAADAGCIDKVDAFTPVFERYVLRFAGGMRYRAYYHPFLAQ